MKGNMHATMFLFFFRNAKEQQNNALNIEMCGEKTKPGTVVSSICASLHLSPFCMWISAAFPPSCNSIKKYD